MKRCELISNLGIFIKNITTEQIYNYIQRKLWIDFKSWYIYQEHYNLTLCLGVALSVVNWFQILVYLSRTLQLNLVILAVVASCELISNLGIFIKNITTIHSPMNLLYVLWVPFILVYLSRTLQRNLALFLEVLSCEFLSFWYIYQEHYNILATLNPAWKVVSSFHFGIFIKNITTNWLSTKEAPTLWVPFILVYLSRTLQLGRFFSRTKLRCEFLSFWYIYQEHYNKGITRVIGVSVVSSFQIW